MPCASTHSDSAGNTSLNAALIAVLLQGSTTSKCCTALCRYIQRLGRQHRGRRPQCNCHCLSAFHSQHRWQHHQLHKQQNTAWCNSRGCHCWRCAGCTALLLCTLGKCIFMYPGVNLPAVACCAGCPALLLCTLGGLLWAGLVCCGMLCCAIDHAVLCHAHAVHAGWVCLLVLRRTCLLWHAVLCDRPCCAVSCLCCAVPCSCCAVSCSCWAISTPTGGDRLAHL